MMQWWRRQTEKQEQLNSKHEKRLQLQAQAKRCHKKQHAYENVNYWHPVSEHKVRCKECPYCGTFVINTTSGDWLFFHELNEESQEWFKEFVREEEFEHIKTVNNITKHIDMGGAI